MPGSAAASPPPGVVGATLTDARVNFAWDRPRGRGCELVLDLSSGKQLWVVATGISSPQEALAEWKALIGQAIRVAKPVVDWPLEGGGRQVTVDLTLENGRRFEADLLEAPARKEDTPLETEWVFEGTPGVEMGRQRPPPRE